MVENLDRNLRHFAEIIRRDLGIDVLEIPGGGAAGGLGAGAVAFAGGKLERGVELVIRAVGLRDRLHDVDLCLTGEGWIDISSASGKTAVGVSRLARSLGVPTIALAGGIAEDLSDKTSGDFDAYFSICPRPSTLDESIFHVSEWLTAVSQQVVRTFLAGHRR